MSICGWSFILTSIVNIDSLSENVSCSKLSVLLASLYSCDQIQQAGFPTYMAMQLPSPSVTRTKDRWSCIGLGLFRFQILADYSRWIPHKSWLPILPSHFHWSQSIPSRYSHSMCPDHSDRPQNHLILSSISTFNCMYSPIPAERQLESGLLPLCDSHHLSSDMLLNVAKCSHHEYQQIQAESADHHHKLSKFMSYCSAPLQSR